MSYRIFELWYFILWRIVPITINGHICTYGYCKIQVGQKFSKSNFYLKKIANRAAKCALHIADIIKWNIIAQKNISQKKPWGGPLCKAFSLGTFSVIHLILILGIWEHLLDLVVRWNNNTKFNIWSAALGSKNWGIDLLFYKKIVGNIRKILIFLNFKLFKKIYIYINSSWGYVPKIFFL